MSVALLQANRYAPTYLRVHLPRGYQRFHSKASKVLTQETMWVFLLWPRQPLSYCHLNLDTYEYAQTRAVQFDILVS